jgi:hypothetical protein
MSICSTTGKPGLNMAYLCQTCRDTGQGSENFSSLGDQGRGTCSPVVFPALPAGAALAAPAFSSSCLKVGDKVRIIGGGHRKRVKRWVGKTAVVGAVCSVTGALVVTPAKGYLLTMFGWELELSQSSFASSSAVMSSGAAAAPVFFIDESDIPY